MALRVVFFGTPAAAVPALRRVHESDHQVLSVVTAPDRPSGRGLRVTASPVKELARASGLPVIQPPTLRDPTVQADLAGLGADVFVVCAYGLILPRAVLGLPPLGCVNIHFSLLPAWRGAAPVAWAILQGDRLAGVTIMQMDQGLDTGPMIRQSSVEIRPEEDTGSLESRLAVVGADLLVEVLDHANVGETPPWPVSPQDDTGASYAAKLTPEQARVDWGQPAGEIVDRVRAFSPRPGAWTTLEGRRLKLWRASVLDGAVGEPGAVTSGPGGAMVVGSARGSLIAEEVQPEGGRRMAGSDLLRGLRGSIRLT